MWFRNLTLLRLTEPFTWSPEELEDRLGRAAFLPCTALEPATYGWTEPLGPRTHAYTHGVGGCVLVCLKREEKILPAAVVREQVVERVAAIEAKEGRTVRRLEQTRLRDEVVQELLPRALSRHFRHYAYLDTRAGWMVVDSANAKWVDLLTGALRQTLGTLPLRPLAVAQAPAPVMTAWLVQGDWPRHCEPGDECELRDTGDGGGVVRCSGQDLAGGEIQAHLQAGKQVTRLALTWKARLSCVLTEALNIRRLRFLDVVQEQVAEAETAEQVFDSQFALMTGELAAFLPELLAAFGGEAETL
jgi:recombination associated protein RdgC